MEKYKIIVSEPWDFKGISGSNSITGKIIKDLSPTTLLFESDNFLDFEAVKGKILLLKSRYEKEILSKDNSYRGTVSGGLYLYEQFENVDINFLENHCKYVLIGSLSKV